MPTNRTAYVAPQEQKPIDRELDPPSHEEITRLAHALWVARGGGDGGAEEDWLEAERMLEPQSSKGQAA
jgi:hypothetical protein